MIFCTVLTGSSKRRRMEDFKCVAKSCLKTSSDSLRIPSAEFCPESLMDSDVLFCQASLECN